MGRIPELEDKPNQHTHQQASEQVRKQRGDRKFATSSVRQQAHNPPAPKRAKDAAGGNYGKDIDAVAHEQTVASGG